MRMTSPKVGKSPPTPPESSLMRQGPAAIGKDAKGRKSQSPMASNCIDKKSCQEYSAKSRLENRKITGLDELPNKKLLINQDQMKEWKGRGHSKGPRMQRPPDVEMPTAPWWPEYQKSGKDGKSLLKEPWKRTHCQRPALCKRKMLTGLDQAPNRNLGLSNKDQLEEGNSIQPSKRSRMQRPADVEIPTAPWWPEYQKSGDDAKPPLKEPWKRTRCQRPALRF